MAENFQNLLENNNLQVHGSQQTPSQINPKRHTDIVKILKVEDRLEKSKKQKKLYITVRGTPIGFMMDFSTEAMDTRREWNNLFKVHK